MKGYGQFCPVARASAILAERWTFLVIRELLCGSHRYNDIRRGIPLISPALLAKRLRTLTDVGIIEARTTSHGREYSLTKAGEELKPIVELLGIWGRQWAHTVYGPEDLDAMLLTWDMHRRVDPSLFTAQRTVIHFAFTDGPKSQRNFWFVNTAEDVELCLLDPGYEVDIWVTTDRETMTRIWMGDLTVPKALDDERLVVDGPPELVRRFDDWLVLSSFAKAPVAAE